MFHDKPREHYHQSFFLWQQSGDAALQVPRCTKCAHLSLSYWQNLREISFNWVFWTYQLANGIQRYDHFRLANPHHCYIIDIIISQSSAVVTHYPSTEAYINPLHQTLSGRHAESDNFSYTVFPHLGPTEKFDIANWSQFHINYEIIFRSEQGTAVNPQYF